MSFLLRRLFGRNHSLNVGIITGPVVVPQKELTSNEAVKIDPLIWNESVDRMDFSPFFLIGFRGFDPFFLEMLVRNLSQTRFLDLENYERSTKGFKLIPAFTVFFGSCCLGLSSFEHGIFELWPEWDS